MSTERVRALPVRQRGCQREGMRRSDLPTELGEAFSVAAALDAGVSPETLRKIESGRVATPSFPTIAAIAAELGLSLDEVWAQISGPTADAAADGPRLAS